MSFRHLLALILYLPFCIQALEITKVATAQGLKPIVTSIQQIKLEEFPNAFNPSIIEYEEGYLLVFRVLPDPLRLYTSRIGVVQLDEALNPITAPTLIIPYFENENIPPQAEDARIFTYQGRLYLIYNDNLALTNPTAFQRRDMYLAELIPDEEGTFSLEKPTKLYHKNYYEKRMWQKNWTPFEWHDALMLSYTLNPHEVLYFDEESKSCLPLISTPLASSDWKWLYGDLRGGTTSLLVDNEYLTFFHTLLTTSSPASNGIRMPHYFMGACTFSADPPFSITKMTPSPIIGEGFYTTSALDKRVVFPGGFVVKGDTLLIAFGKDDHEMWIATLDKKLLNKFLEPVSSLK